MAQLDQEDIKFLEDLTEELTKHDGVYDAEVIELVNIIHRARIDDSMLTDNEKAMVRLGL